ncbi:protein TolQ [Limibaculum sp. M0105]|uniref:Tol-Pal system protein TolQ n=1 Tax=Thermohalobaculum xanthum TaxID=2753746 RepID=A0A8J7SE86_9RHOB|nr:protein TolQ [Thermohalobaculum xanthum]MBK0399346.1 protein TolQ [Thermohalobaculum xanthum]
MDVLGLSTAAIGLVQSAATEAPLGLPAAGEVDFSAWSLFLRATVVVQVVMILLVLVSFWSWAIIFDKTIQFGRLRRMVAQFEGDFWSGQPLEELFDRIGQRARSPIERVFVAGMTEWNRSVRKVGGMMPGTQQRVERAMDVAIARESEEITKRLPFLATVGSVSPFVGLFGTVWGIKHSFESIAMQQSTNLAVVAPGIAEALFATALGLLAAIPAVVAYNRLQADADRLTGGLENFADEFSTILGRQLDRQSGGEA